MVSRPRGAVPVRPAEQGKRPAQGCDELLAKVARNEEIDRADLSELDWEDADWTGARFRDCSISGSHIGGARLGDASFVGCRFVRCRFSNTVLRGASFEACTLSEAEEGSACVFAFADLEESRFLRCDLSLCQFQRCGMFSLEMDECKLQGAVFDQVDFSHSYGRKVITNRVTFRSCNLSFVELERSRLLDSEFVNSTFRESNLRHADLSGADLRDCTLVGTDLTQATLDGADLRGAEINGLNLLETASFARLKVSQGQMFPLLQAMGLDVHPDRPGD